MPVSMHPTSRTLIAYLDGELEAEQRGLVAGHLRNCPNCRNELDYMEADLDWFLILEAAVQPASAAPPSGALDRLLVKTRQWRAADPRTTAAAADDPMPGDRMSEALELFLGPALAETITGETGGAEGSADDAESLLSAFLGRRAGAALMTNLERQMRAGRFPSPDVS
jgi:anti-sigma factor RsiW